MDSTSEKHLNFDGMVNIVHNYVLDGKKDSCTVVQRRIERMSDRNVVTKFMKKTYKMVYDKRVILSDFSTLPFGY